MASPSKRIAEALCEIAAALRRQAEVAEASCRLQERMLDNQTQMASSSAELERALRGSLNQ